MSLRSAGDDVVSRIARLLELEGDRWRPHRRSSCCRSCWATAPRWAIVPLHIRVRAPSGLRPAAVPVGGVRGDPRVLRRRGRAQRARLVREEARARRARLRGAAAQTIVVVRDRADRRKAFFLDGMRYRNAAAYENLADSGFARTLSEDDLEALLSRMLAFLTGDDAFSEAETTSVGPLRGSSCAF